MSSRFTLADYAAGLRRLLPWGRAWSAEPDTVQGKVLEGLAGSMQRTDAAANDLLEDTFPATTEALLPEWENSLGLPDPCSGPSPTDDQRRAQVVARLIGGGGLSRGRYIAYAAELGFVIEIVTYAPFRVEINGVGHGVAGDEWSFAWGVRILANTSGLPASFLLCKLEAIRPAETIVLLLT